MSGVICDENENLKEKVLKVFGKTEAHTTNGDIIKAYRIGKFDHNADEVDYCQILVEFKTVDMKRNVLRNSKKLKDWKDGKNSSLGVKNIYINFDETPLTRNENARLHKERNRLRDLEENANKRIFISKGKLKIDDVIHDEFNIENQLLTI